MGHFALAPRPLGHRTMAQWAWITVLLSLLTTRASEHGGIHYTSNYQMCPQHYWAAEVHINRKLNRAFKLVDLDQESSVTQDSRDKRCGFCKNVLCFVGLQKDRKIVTCQPPEKLPAEDEILLRLDCVMIGNSTQLFLFIYQPFDKKEDVIADCVDRNFLQWVDKGTNLTGFEFGVRSKRLPRNLVPKNKILHKVKYLAFDTSATNLSVAVPGRDRVTNQPFLLLRRSGLNRTTKPPLKNACDGKNDSLQTCAEYVPDHDCCSPFMSIAEKEEKCVYQVAPKVTKAPVREKDYYSLMSALLWVVVLVLSVTCVATFCIRNPDKVKICRQKKRRQKEEEERLAREREAANEESNVVLAPVQWNNNATLRNRAGSLTNQQRFAQQNVRFAAAGRM